jgi:thiol-disulfide isomerase/thioredoxin
VVGELLLQRAPELSGLTAVKGASIGSVLELRGKVVLIEFWSTHCSVCRYLVPVLNDYHARFGPQGLVVLGITNEPVVVADRAARELGIEYGVQSDVQALTTRAYQASALPALYLIDRTGTVRAVHLGYTSRGMSELGELVAELVRGP